MTTRMDKEVAVFPVSNADASAYVALNLIRFMVREHYKMQPSDDSGAHDFYIGRSSQNAAEKFLVELPEANRQIIRFYYYEGMDIGEIAEKLQVSYSTARRRLANAQDKLRKIHLSEENSPKIKDYQLIQLADILSYLKFSEESMASMREVSEEAVLTDILDDLLQTGEHISKSLDSINTDLKEMVALAQETR